MRSNPDNLYEIESGNAEYKTEARTCINKINRLLRENYIPPSKQAEIKKLMNNATSYPNADVLEKLQACYDTYQPKATSDDVENFAIFDGVNASDVASYLHKVSVPHYPGTVWLLFNKAWIKGYKDINNEDVEKFEQLLAGDLKTLGTRDQRHNGVKKLKLSGKPCSCQLSVDGKQYPETAFTHEIKINSANRIGVIPIKPNRSGSTILVATHYIAGGFHDNRYEGKVLTQSIDTRPASLSQSTYSLFAPRSANKPCCAEVNEKTTSTVKPSLGTCTN